MANNKNIENIKMKDFIAGVEYRPFDSDNSSLIVRKLQKLKMKTGEWSTKNYYIDNSSTNGICHQIYQNLFKVAKTQFIAEDGYEVVSISIPKSASKTIGVAENLRHTFTWAGMKFERASIVIQPGNVYILPVPAAIAVRRFMESKNLIPESLGMTEQTKDIYFLRDANGVEVEIKDYDLSLLDY